MVWNDGKRRCVLCTRRAAAARYRRDPEYARAAKRKSLVRLGLVEPREELGDVCPFTQNHLALVAASVGRERTVAQRQRREVFVAEPEALEQFVVYRSPRDYPGKFVVRRWSIEAAGPSPREVRAVVGTLEAARSKIPRGLFMFVRSAEDDPCIVETWL